MPERRPLLRRAAYLMALTTASGAFAFSLAGIAGTKGQVRPNGHAATLVRQQLRQQAPPGCHHRRHPVAMPSSQREV